MAQIFHIPEVLCLICEQARKTDLARLLSTSCLFFDCAMPLVWRSLPESAPMILMNLIPDSNKYLNTNLNTKLVAAFLDDLQPLDPFALVRFNLYAPQVRRVVRHRRNKQTNVMWDRLLKLVGTHPILPNLEVLEISLSLPRESGSIIQDPASLLSAYLYPKLVQIDDLYRYKDSPIEQQKLCDLVSNIARRCPQIRSLKLSSMISGAIMSPKHAREFANSLSQLCNLRILGLNSMALNPRTLVALINLPKLESLTLGEELRPDEWLRPGEPPGSLKVILPDGSFPALRHLGIKVCFVIQPAIQMWGITALVQHLTSVSVCIRVPADSDEIRHLVRTICRCSPSITSLSLDCTRAIGCATLLASGIIEDLAPLRLRHLSLYGNDNNYGGAWPSSENIALAFPNMECLRIHGYSFLFEDLLFIAKHMHRLQQLSMRVQVNTDWPLSDELSSLAFAPSHSRLYFHFSGACPAPGRPAGARFMIPNEKIEMIAA
ncbi:unnamed protein product [Rhizoctonia solani]|uniref:F-box domain-containing protein n=1 Tax=Rhizoctonia solani TaxID=456999 RepID=A0A8H3CHL1_9AGAM|nr:unnamed protein product [Rhizoctonia solani]